VYSKWTLYNIPELFVYLSIAAYIALSDSMIVINELGRMWKDAAMV
jgi:hypothetical protein